MFLSLQRSSLKNYRFETSARSFWLFYFSTEPPGSLVFERLHPPVVRSIRLPFAYSAVIKNVRIYLLFSFLYCSRFTQVKIAFEHHDIIRYKQSLSRLVCIGPGRVSQTISPLPAPRRCCSRRKFGIFLEVNCSFYKISINNGGTRDCEGWWGNPVCRTKIKSN